MTEHSARAWNTPDGTADALPPSDIMLRDLIGLSDQAIISVDERQRIVLFNQSAEAMFGYAADEVLGQPLAVLLPPSTRPVHESHLGNALQQKTFSRRMNARRPVRGRRHDGTEFEALISISVVHHGGTSVATAVVQDVSALMAVREELRSSEARVRTIVDASPAGIVTVAADGTVLEANPAFLKLLGLPALSADAPLRLPAVLIDENGWERLKTQIESGGPDHSDTYRFRTESGESDIALQIHALRSAALNASSDFGSLFAIDVTERQRLEETVRRTERLDLVGRLAGGIAHDFNNLLLLIRLSASMIAEQEELTESGREDLDALERAAIRAGDLTHQLLTIGRRQVMQPSVLDLSALVRHQSDFLQRLLGEDVALHLVLPDSPVHVLADESQLERVLVNLTTNARDAMPQGGRVEIAIEVRDPSDADRLLCPLLESSTRVHLRFADTGAGMDARTRSHIFDPFYSTKEFGRGTGLGLASVYGIVEQSDGQIGVCSAPGAGTSFHLWFPESGEVEHPTAPRAEPASAGAFKLPVSVLLVEDDDAVRALLGRILASRGISVIEAGSGSEALARLGELDRPLDVLITDIVLPGMSGPRLAAEISALPLHAKAKTLFVSGYSPDAAHHRGGLGPDSTLLTKPFTPAALLRELATLLTP